MARPTAKAWLTAVLLGCLLASGCVNDGSSAPPAGGSTTPHTSDPGPTQPSTPTATSPTRTLRPGYPMVGVQFQGTWSTYTDTQRAELLDKLVAMGIRTVRIGISWAMIQPDAPTADDPGWNWTWGIPRVDQVIAMARARGLVVHATFGRTPSWANGGKGETTAPANLADWRRAVAFVAHRYAGKVSSWEIWNEPNLPKFLTGASPTTYTRLLCSAYPIIHRQSPDTPVVFGGVSGNDWQFISDAYQAGAKGCFDVLAVHPYQRWGYAPGAPAPSPEPWYFSNVTLVRGVERDNDDLKPIWFTELGWSTHANTAQLPEYQRGVNEQTQARYLVRALQLTRQRYPYVARVYIYQARDETGFTIENNNFGLFTTTLQPKPAVAAVRRYLASE